jgi:hypothetical protein
MAAGGVPPEQAVQPGMFGVTASWRRGSDSVYIAQKIIGLAPQQSPFFFLTLPLDPTYANLKTNVERVLDNE